MAIYHLTVKVLGRSSNHKAVAAAAYRSGTCLNDERYEQVHDYSRRAGGVVHSEIMAPEDAPDWVADREVLWNEVEKTERRKDSQLAREIEMALPRELSLEDQLKLVRSFIANEAVDRGMIADFAIHERASTDGGGNPHAHVLLTMRRATPDGFGPKERDWNDTEVLEGWREKWADYCNEALASCGEVARVDHRTLEEQGILREPTIHMGKEAFHAQAKGEEPERVQLSAVERAMMPYDRQLEEHGHIVMDITPEAGESWWDKVASYTQRMSDYAGEWYDWAREKVQGWRGAVASDRDGPTLER